MASKKIALHIGRQLVSRNDCSCNSGVPRMGWVEHNATCSWLLTVTDANVHGQLGKGNRAKNRPRSSIAPLLNRQMLQECSMELLSCPPPLTCVLFVKCSPQASSLMGNMTSESQPSADCKIHPHLQYTSASSPAGLHPPICGRPLPTRACCAL